MVIVPGAMELLVQERPLVKLVPPKRLSELPELKSCYTV
jgi:hypothetical protein